MFTGVEPSRPECTSPVIFKGLKTAQLGPCSMGTAAAFATITIVNGSPASFNVSFPLTAGFTNVPAAVYVTFGAAAPQIPGTVNPATTVIAAVQFIMVFLLPLIL